MGLAVAKVSIFPSHTHFRLTLKSFTGDVLSGNVGENHTLKHLIKRALLDDIGQLAEHLAFKLVVSSERLSLVAHTVETNEQTRKHCC